MPNFVLEYVAPQQLGDVWDQIKDGVASVHAHSSKTWRVEDLYMLVKQGAVTLHIGYLDSNYAGFIVLMQKAAYDGNVLHIWATYSVARDFCVFTQGIQTLREYAKNINAKRISFDSPRKGWEKHGKKLGFKPLTVKYAMEV